MSNENKTEPAKQNKTNMFPRNDTSIFKEQYLLCFEQKCFPDAFLSGLPSFVIVMSYNLVIFLNMLKLPLLRA
jgi:hypothetical protein